MSSMDRRRKKRTAIYPKDEDDAYKIEETNMHNDPLWICQFYLVIFLNGDGGNEFNV